MKMYFFSGWETNGECFAFMKCPSPGAPSSLDKLDYWSVTALSSRISVHGSPRLLLFSLIYQEENAAAEVPHITSGADQVPSHHERKQFLPVILRLMGITQLPEVLYVCIKITEDEWPTQQISSVCSEKSGKYFLHRKYFLCCKTWMGIYSYKAPDVQTKPERKAAQINSEIPLPYTASQGMVLHAKFTFPNQ